MAREMKDSGIQWIGIIPKNWRIIKFKNLIKSTNAGEVIDKSYWNSGSEILYTCQRTPLLSDYDGFPYEKRAQTGDILLTRNATPYIFIPQRGAIYSNVVQRVKLFEGFDIHYIKYALLLGAESLTVNGNTIPSYNMEVWKSIVIPCIEVNEQKAISNYLDRHCSRIDSVIEQTRASIEEYKKLKQAVITQAVTKGIRPNREMKDSGIKWIGEIPSDWVTTKLKYFAVLRSGITLGKIYPKGTLLKEYPYLRVANVKGSYIDIGDVATIMVTEEESVKYRLHYGELLLTEGGDRDKLGRGAIWHEEIDPCLHQNHVFAITTDKSNLCTEYVSYLSESYVGRDYFDVTANQSVHLASTNSSTILNFIIPFPTLDEQIEIIRFLDIKVKMLNRIIRKKQNLLTELESYKKSLIFEYVTGKKEVPA